MVTIVVLLLLRDCCREHFTWFGEVVELPASYWYTTRPTTERLLLERLTREIALDEVIRRSGDHQRIGRRQVLQPRRNVRRLPQR